MSNDRRRLLGLTHGAAAGFFGPVRLRSLAVAGLVALSLSVAAAAETRPRQQGPHADTPRAPSTVPDAPGSDGAQPRNGTRDRDPGSPAEGEEEDGQETPFGGGCPYRQGPLELIV